MVERVMVEEFMVEKYGVQKKSCCWGFHPSIRNRAVWSKGPFPNGTFDGAARCVPCDTKCTYTKEWLRVYWGLYLLWFSPHCVALRPARFH